MKKNTLSFLTSFLLFMAALEGTCYDSCFADTNFYAKFFGGANILADTTADGNDAAYHTGYVVAGSLGYHWHYGLRLEAEYAYRRNNISEIYFFIEGSSETGHFQTSSYMANLLWDVPWNCTCLQPYIGVGIGYDFQQMHSSNSRIIFNQDWKHFSWQLIAGLAYPIFCGTDLTLEYKFHEGGTQFNNHSIGVGLVYNFCCLR